MSLKLQKLVSIIVPIYNDAYLAEAFCQSVEKSFGHYFKSIDQQAPLTTLLEVIFVNDGSRRDSEDRLDEVVKQFSFASVFHFSRNFGQHIAVSCGYRQSEGETVVMMNVDQEDSPDEIIKMIQHLKKSGCDIVHGLYDNRRVSFLNKITSTFFGVLLNRLTGYNLPLNATTARVMNRSFIQHYNALTEHQRYIPALEMWLGFRHEYIETKHQLRGDKNSSYNFFRRLKMAMDAVVTFSDLPLKIASGFGFIIAMIGFIMMVSLLVRNLSGADIQLGFTSTFSAITLFGGISILVTGMAGLYIGSILREVQGRPLYIVRRTSRPEQAK